VRMSTSRLESLAVLILSSLLIAPVSVEAQSGRSGLQGRSPWIGFGIGAGAFSGVGGVAGHVDVGWGFGRAYLAGRLAGVTDSLACCEVTEGDRTDAAVLIGLQRVAESGVVAIALGPAYVRGQHLDETTWGLGLEARLVKWGGRGIGPALYVFGNLNSKDSFFGVTLGIRFGGR